MKLSNCPTVVKSFLNILYFFFTDLSVFCIGIISIFKSLEAMMKLAEMLLIVNRNPKKIKNSMILLTETRTLCYIAST